MSYGPLSRSMSLRGNPYLSFAEIFKIFSLKIFSFALPIQSYFLNLFLISSAFMFLWLIYFLNFEVQKINSSRKHKNRKCVEKVWETRIRWKEQNYWFLTNLCKTKLRVFPHTLMLCMDCVMSYGSLSHNKVTMQHECKGKEISTLVL
jgi:hypothetical protein